MKGDCYSEWRAVVLKWLGLTALGAGRYLTLPFPFSFRVPVAPDCHFSVILSD